MGVPCLYLDTLEYLIRETLFLTIAKPTPHSTPPPCGCEC